MVWKPSMYIWLTRFSRLFVTTFSLRRSLSKGSPLNPPGVLQDTMGPTRCSSRATLCLARLVERGRLFHGPFLTRAPLNKDSLRNGEAPIRTWKRPSLTFWALELLVVGIELGVLHSYGKRLRSYRLTMFVRLVRFCVFCKR